jgi:hypothetical protein
MQKKSIGFILNETCYRIFCPGQWQLFVRVSAITPEGVRLDLEQPQTGPHTLWKVDRETLPVGEGLDLTLDRLDGETDSFRVFADDQSAGMATLRFEYPEHLMMQMHTEDHD